MRRLLSVAAAVYALAALAASAAALADVKISGVFFYRSTDGGRTSSNPMKISDSVHQSQFCDIAVRSNGTAFVARRQFGFKNQQDNAVAWAKPTDGGASFTKPGIAATFTGWDPVDEAASPGAAADASYLACLAGDAPDAGACARAPAA
jgi:hypothetical protein